MTRFLLARHGLTDWNAGSRFQGQTDLALNETGLEQVGALGRCLASEPLAAIYTSGLRRARQTVQAVLAARPEQARCPVFEDSRLTEISFGDWEGLTYTEIQQRDPQALQNWLDDLYHVAPPGGESLQNMAARVQAAFQDMLKAYPQGTVLIVAHGGPLQTLICQALQVPAHKFWQFHLAPASLSDLSIYPEGAILNLLNATSHLEKG